MLKYVILNHRSGNAKNIYEAEKETKTMNYLLAQGEL